MFEIQGQLTCLHTTAPKTSAAQKHWTHPDTKSLNMSTLHSWCWCFWHGQCFWRGRCFNAHDVLAQSMFWYDRCFVTSMFWRSRTHAGERQSLGDLKNQPHRNMDRVETSATPKHRPRRNIDHAAASYN